MKAMYSFNNANHSKRKENGNYNYFSSVNLFFSLTQQILCFHFPNSSNALLIKKYLKVECTVGSPRTYRILGNLGEIKYNAGTVT